MEGMPTNLRHHAQRRVGSRVRVMLTSIKNLKARLLSAIKRSGLVERTSVTVVPKDTITPLEVRVAARVLVEREREKVVKNDSQLGHR